MYNFVNSLALGSILTVAAHSFGFGIQSEIGAGANMKQAIVFYLTLPVSSALGMPPTQVVFSFILSQVAHLSACLCSL